jgi:hypothetical protein
MSSKKTISEGRIVIWLEDPEFACSFRRVSARS